MKFKPKRRKRKQVPAGSQTKPGGKQKGIKLGDGSFHLPEHEKLGWFVGYWNGEKCQCRVIVATVEKPERSIHSHPWYLPFVGQEVQAIEISYYGETFWISNQDGAGMQKITVGKGSPKVTHAQFEKVEVIKVVMDMKEWIMDFDFELSCEIAERGETYWQVRDPEHWKKIREMRLDYMATYREINIKVAEMLKEEPTHLSN